MSPVLYQLSYRGIPERWRKERWATEHVFFVSRLTFAWLGNVSYRGIFMKDKPAVFLSGAIFSLRGVPPGEHSSPSARLKERSRSSAPCGLCRMPGCDGRDLPVANSPVSFICILCGGARKIGQFPSPLLLFPNFHAQVFLRNDVGCGAPRGVHAGSPHRER